MSGGDFTLTPVQGGYIGGFETLAQLSLGSGDDHVQLGDLQLNFALAGADGADSIAGGGFADTIQGQAGDDSLNGLGGDDSLAGGQGNDTLAGGSGVNTLQGGAGNNTVSYADVSGSVNVDLSKSGAQETGQSTDTLTNIENIVGSHNADVLKGDDSDNHIDTGGGFDTIVATLGSDTLEGGSTQFIGVAEVSYAEIGSRVTIDLKKGSAHLQTGDDQTLINLYRAIGSDFNDKIIGDKAWNYLAGGEGADTITGGAGNDTLVGGAGHNSLNGDKGRDIIDFSNSGGAGVTADLSAGTAVVNDGSEVDTLVSIEGVVGGDGDDMLSGDSVSNLLIGNGGNDTLDAGSGRSQEVSGGDGDDLIRTNGSDDEVDGGDGDDTLFNGAGHDNAFYGDDGADTFSNGTGLNNAFDGGDGQHDTVKFDETAGGVRVDLSITGKEQATGGAGAIYIDGVENLVGSAFNDALRGDGSDNLLAGGDGADTLNGGDGDDTLQGDAGFDTASYAGAGLTFKRPAGFDKGVTVDLAVSGSQNTGVAGMDTLVSIENLIGSANKDSLAGDESANSLWGGNGRDVLSGREGADVLMGGAAADKLNGGLGADVLSGGAGADHFIFNSVADSPTAAAADLITDLDAHDHIDLRQIDANGNRPGNASFFFVDAFDGHSREAVLTYDSASGLSSLALDTDGDKQADMVIHMTGDQTGFDGFLL